MQIVSCLDNLHEYQNPLSGKNKKNTVSLLPAELAKKVVNVNTG